MSDAALVLELSMEIARLRYDLRTIVNGDVMGASDMADYAKDAVARSLAYEPRFSQVAAKKAFRGLYVAYAARKRGQLGFGSVVVTTDFVVSDGAKIEELGAEIEKRAVCDEGSVVIVCFQRMESTVEDQKPFTVAHIDPPRAAPSAGQVQAAPSPAPATADPPTGLVRNVVDPTLPPKPQSVDMLRLCATIARLLAELTSEVRRCTPSHTWDRMPEIYEQTRQLRDELEELTK